MIVQERYVKAAPRAILNHLPTLGQRTWRWTTGAHAAPFTGVTNRERPPMPA